MTKTVCIIQVMNYLQNDFQVHLPPSFRFFSLSFHFRHYNIHFFSCFESGTRHFISGSLLKLKYLESYIYGSLKLQLEVHKLNATLIKKLFNFLIIELHHGVELKKKKVTNQFQLFKDFHHLRLKMIIPARDRILPSMMK